jgi:hypothetical protein
MAARHLTFAAALAAAALTFPACKSNHATEPEESAGGTTAGTTGTAGGSGSAGSGTGTGTGTSVPALVSVDLRNVLNNLSVDLRVNRDNIPVTAQVPVEIAASVCGVSVSALAASIASGKASCTATTTSPQLTQAVQQQIASGGSVTGGPQTMGSTNNMM